MPLVWFDANCSRVPRSMTGEPLKISCRIIDLVTWSNVNRLNQRGFKCISSVAQGGCSLWVIRYRCQRSDQSVHVCFAPPKATCIRRYREKKRRANRRHWAVEPGRPTSPILSGQPARSTRRSISLRSVTKSIGLVRSVSAPFSSALRLVAASP
jgi:hypothetical protein